MNSYARQLKKSIDKYDKTLEEMIHFFEDVLDYDKLDPPDERIPSQGIAVTVMAEKLLDEIDDFRSLLFQLK